MGLDYGNSGGFIDKLLQVLPRDPFIQFLSWFGDLPYMGYLNFFVPIGDMITITEAWVGAVAVLWLWLAAMRWAKLVR